MATFPGFDFETDNNPELGGSGYEEVRTGAANGYDPAPHESGVYEADPYGMSRRPDEVSPDLRPFPNEDLGFWIKRIDNSRRVRQEDPGLAEMCWRFFSATSLVAVVVVGLLAPNAYTILNGFRMQQLQDRNEYLKSELRKLELKRSELTSPVRMEALAKRYGFVDAPRDRVIRLRGTEGEAVSAWRRIQRESDSR
ncbi:MAG: hypothetical protein R2729_17015 [Bryobacteraceae bacterium]